MYYLSFSITFEAVDPSTACQKCFQTFPDYIMRMADLFQLEFSHSKWETEELEVKIPYKTQVIEVKLCREIQKFQSCYSILRIFEETARLKSDLLGVSYRMSSDVKLN